MDLKEYFSKKEDINSSPQEIEHFRSSLWQVFLMKSVYAFIRAMNIISWPCVKLFQICTNVLKHHTAYKQRDLFETPSFLSRHIKKGKYLFSYIRMHFEGPTFAFMHDWFIAFLSVPLAFLLKGDFSFEGEVGSFIVYQSILFSLTTLGVFLIVGLYEAKYRPPLAPDLIDHLKIVFLSIGLYIPLYSLTNADNDFSFSFLIMLSLIFFAGLLLSRLLYFSGREKFSSFLHFRNIHSIETFYKKEKKSQKNVLLIGAPYEAAKIYAALEKNESVFKVIGTIQENPALEERQDLSIKVLGKIKDLKAILADLENRYKMPDEILIVDFNLNRQVLSHILEVTNSFEIPVKKFARTIFSHEVFTRPLMLEDFCAAFGDSSFDGDLLNDFVKGRRFLVTGAGGTLGVAFVQEIVLLQPSHIILVDCSELNLSKIERDLRQKFPDLSYVSYLCDITGYHHFSQIVYQEKPDYIFHFAGIKQVNMVEKNPDQAVLTNIIGLKNIADIACTYGVKKVIFPSILQAHKPQNVLEVTKRIAEGYLQYLQFQRRHVDKKKQNNDDTQFYIVRLENLLGSSGSVVTLFRETLRHQRKIFLTHLEMQRAFITLQDAVLFLLTVPALMEQSVESFQTLFEIKTQTPLKIISLAKYITLLSGYVPEEEVKFHVNGLRKGEYLPSTDKKEFQELKETSFPGIYLSEQPLYDGVILLKVLKELEEAARSSHTEKTLQLLHYLVPSFNLQE